MTIAKRSKLSALVVLGLFPWVAPPRAQAADWAVAGGALEAIVVPGGRHGGLYGVAGACRVIPRGSVILVPSLLIEGAPDTQRWGFIGAFTVDIPLGERIGLDLGLALVTDQSGAQFREALVVGGAGPGLSVFLGPWTVSPSVSALRVLNGTGWALVPGLLVSRVLPE